MYFVAYFHFSALKQGVKKVAKLVLNLKWIRSLWTFLVGIRGLIAWNPRPDGVQIHCVLEWRGRRCVGRRHRLAYGPALTEVLQLPTACGYLRIHLTHTQFQSAALQTCWLSLNTFMFSERIFSWKFGSLCVMYFSQFQFIKYVDSLIRLPQFISVTVDNK